MCATKFLATKFLATKFWRNLEVVEDSCFELKISVSRGNVQRVKISVGSDLNEQFNLCFKKNIMSECVKVRECPHNGW